MKKPVLKTGMTAVEVITELVKSFPEISSISLWTYIPANLKEFIPDRIDRHNPPDQMIEIQHKGVLAGGVDGILRSLTDGKHHLAFSSKLKGLRKDFFVPLMDFKCEDSPENLEKVEQFLAKIGQKKGVILASGQSYHYYGFELLSEEQWRVFVAKCLLSELRDLQLIDVSYIGHALWDGFGILRISSSAHYPKTPTAVSVLK